MENASKALIMAGGVLLAIMILAMLVSVGISISDIAGVQDEKNAIKQVEEFNKSYLAYNKNRMYGIDIITVVNKAIDYNKRLDVNDEKYKINIILNLNQDFNRTKQTVTQYANGETKEEPIQTVLQGSLRAGTYQLFEREGSTKMNSSITNFLEQEPDSKDIKKYATKIETIFTYSAITNFKTAVFECGNISYSNLTGRINSITFNQI